jgi:exopolysaccharide biosynthesis polyprenyl glycosylphosphotransferase
MFYTTNVQSEVLLNDIRNPKTVKISTWQILFWLKLVSIFILDSLAITEAWIIAQRAKMPVDVFQQLGKNWGDFGWLLPIVAVYLGILFASGMYGGTGRRLLDLFRSLCLAHLTLVLIAFFVEPSLWLSHSFFLEAWLLTLLFVCGIRIFFAQIIHTIKIKFDFFKRKVILLGVKEDLTKIKKLLERVKVFRVVDAIDLSKQKDIDKLSKTVDTYDRALQVDEVFICSWEHLDDPIMWFWKLKSAGINWRIIPTSLNLPVRWSEIAMVGEFPAIRFCTSAIVGVDFWCKRLFDLVVSFFLLLLLSIPMVSIALAIKLDSPGSVFYKQTRVGLNNKHFQVWKFRTMVENASQMQKELEVKNEIQGGILFKIKDDPRITKVGKFLRSYSLDELPQLINVLLGEMSLVGPRPLPVRDVEKLSDSHSIRHEVLPGITGLWQVSGRSDSDSDAVFYWDFFYIQNWSLSLDCRILLRTVRVVLAKEGAY